MTQPLPTRCTANRYALNTWHQGVAHPRHRCTDGAGPHPTRPHICVCGEVWAGVGATTSCSHCGTDSIYGPVGKLRIENDGKGHVVYLCVDRLACRRVYARANRAAQCRHQYPRSGREMPNTRIIRCDLPANHGPDDHEETDTGVTWPWLQHDGDTIGGPAPGGVDLLNGEPYTPPSALLVAMKAHARFGHTGPVCASCREHARIAWSVMVADGADPPAESDSAAPGVPEGTDDRADAESSHVAGALGIVVGLLNVIRQADVGVPPMRTIVYGLGMAKRELEQATTATPPYIRQPGDPVRHLDVTA